MVGLVEPTISDTMIDPACGTGGFLFNAYEYVIERIQSPYRQEDEETLFPGTKAHLELQQWFKQYFSDNTYTMPEESVTQQFYRSGIYGVEYLGMIRKMAAVNFYIRHLNPANLQQGDALDLFNAEMHESKSLVLANPPFGAERDKPAYANIWEDYPKESETTILFVKMMLDMLKPGGRCAVVVSEGFLTWEQGSAKALRKMLLQENNLQAVIGLPQGVFVSKGGQGPKTSILLFSKGMPTQQVWFYNVENDGYSKGTNRSEIKGCQLTEALDLYHQYIKQGKTAPETSHSFTLSVDWLNIVDPRVKGKIRQDVQEKLKPKQNVAHEKLVARLDIKLEKAKTAKPGTKTAQFDQAANQLEIDQLEATWKNKIQAEIAMAIDKAHLYSFNSSNYRSTLADNQLQDWADLVQHHKPEANGHSLDKRYTALMKSPLQGAIKQVAQFDPKNAIEADIVREYISSIAQDELAQYAELVKLDAIFKSGAKYPLVKLRNYLQLATKKIKPNKNPGIKFRVLGVSNDTGVFLNETLKPEQTNQSYFFVEKGQFCYNPYRINVGSIGLNRFDYDNQIISGAYVVFGTDEIQLLSAYLLALFKTKSFTAYVNLKASGGVRMNFTFEFLEDWEIPLPPAEIQKQIIEQIENQIEIINGVNKILKSWSINRDQFYGEFKRIGDFSQVGTGSTPPRDNKENFIGNNHWVLTNEIEDCEIYNTCEKLSDDAVKKYSLTIYPENSILIAMYGQGKTRGRSSILKIPSAITQNCGAIIVNEQIVNPYYIWYFLLSIYEEIRGKDYSGGGVPHLNLTIIKDIQVPIPGLDVQNKIVLNIRKKLKTISELNEFKTEAENKTNQIIKEVWAD